MNVSRRKHRITTCRATVFQTKSWSYGGLTVVLWFMSRKNASNFPPIKVQKSRVKQRTCSAADMYFSHRIERIKRMQDESRGESNQNPWNPWHPMFKKKQQITLMTRIISVISEIRCWYPHRWHILHRRKSVKSVASDVYKENTRWTRWTGRRAVNNK